MPAAELVTCALQLNSQSDVQANLEQVAVLTRKAASRGARLLLLPENFAFFGGEADKRRLAEELAEAGGPIVAALSELARECGVYLVAGGMPERTADAERPHNTALVIGPDGAELGRYRKIHLFDVELGAGGSYAESAATLAGAEPLVLEIDGFKVGLSICYDLRFPELYRALSDLGAEVLLVPAAFTLHTGKDHWHVLLRARAIEAQAFVVAAAQWGRHPGERQTYGHSLVVDPWGTVIAEASDGVGMVLATLTRERLEAVRRSLPSLRHRRL